MSRRKLELAEQGSFFEGLEQRRLLSAEVLPSGTLLLTGTTGDDSIQVQGTSVEGQVIVFGVPSDSTMFAPTIRAGRWLQPGDGQAVTLHDELAQKIREGQRESIFLGVAMSMLVVTAAGGATSWLRPTTT